MLNFNFIPEVKFSSGVFFKINSVSSSVKPVRFNIFQIWFIRRTNLLATHTTDDCIVPVWIYPGREILLAFIQIRQAILGMNQKTVGWIAAGGSIIAA